MPRTSPVDGDLARRPTVRPAGGMTAPPLAREPATPPLRARRRLPAPPRQVALAPLQQPVPSPPRQIALAPPQQPVPSRPALPLPAPPPGSPARGRHPDRAVVRPETAPVPTASTIPRRRNRIAADARHAADPRRRTGSTRTRTTRTPPVAAFSAVMGLAGTSLAWQRALPGPQALPVGELLARVALGVLTVLVAAIVGSAVRRPHLLRAQWDDPVSRATLPTATLALMLVGTALIGPLPDLARVLWWAGALGQFVLGLAVLRSWTTGPGLTLDQLHPGWFMPAVANLVGPLGGTRLGAQELCWLQFASGLLFWLPMLALVLGRLVLGGALPPRLTPTLAILIAPPAVAALDWQLLGGSPLDAVARVFLGAALFHGLLLLAQGRQLLRIPFGVSSWALTFPCTALAGALLAAGRAGAGRGYVLLGDAVLGAATALVAVLAVRSLVAVLGRRRS